MHKKRILFYFILVIFLIAFNFYLRPVEGNPLVDDAYKSNGAYVNDLYYSNEYFKSMLSHDGKKLYEKIIDASINNKSDIEIECSSNPANVYVPVSSVNTLITSPCAFLTKSPVLLLNNINCTPEINFSFSSLVMKDMLIHTHLSYSMKELLLMVVQVVSSRIMQLSIRNSWIS